MDLQHKEHRPWQHLQEADRSPEKHGENSLHTHEELGASLRTPTPTPRDDDSDDSFHHRETLSHRERLRVQRLQQFSSPARFKITLGSVIGVVIGVVLFVGVWWWIQRDFVTPESDTAFASEVSLKSDDSSQDLQAQDNATNEDDVSVAEAPATGSVLDEAEELSGADDVHALVNSEESAHSKAVDRHSDESSEGTESAVVAYIAGAVEQAQVVYLRPGQRVIDAVDLAGGLREDAAADAINLAATVEDGAFLRIPTHAEVDEGVATQTPETGAVDGATTAQADSGDDELINLNTADETQLQELPGIGPAMAERIIAHRETSPEFTSLEDLAAISGIGPATLENIADAVTW